MEADYVKSFLVASCAVLKSAANIEVDIENTYLKSFTPHKDQVLFSAAIHGKYQGLVTLSMSKATACTIACGMLQRASIPELDELALSAISEMANMILGNTMTMFSLTGVALDISLSDFAGCPAILDCCPNPKTICVPLRAPSGNAIEFNLALSNSPSYSTPYLP